uniref:Chromodomain helicase DNA binding protein 1-like n=1 Tax=Scleropages formosus TaxID=113540 RepID=A0A8C9WMU2_SCLFO
MKQGVSKKTEHSGPFSSYSIEGDSCAGIISGCLHQQWPGVPPGGSLPRTLASATGSGRLRTQHRTRVIVRIGLQLRPYQLGGVRWLSQCLKNQEGCILGDEMGLGKTCQTVSLLVYIRGSQGHEGPFLILILCDFAPMICYRGDKEKRAELQSELKTGRRFHVLLTTYELCLKDASFLRRWQWRVLVVDEAHRLKNQNSVLHNMLSEFSFGFKVLLTGTPIQNNLQEVYALLSFIQPSIFPKSEVDDFVSTYSQVETQPVLASELHSILKPFLLRRVKAEVAAELPRKIELVVYHGMSALQKRYYKAILMKDIDAFENEQGSKTRLLNILMELRKCVNHPYLFDGVEPEPFEMGEHLIEASGKLCLLDSMLRFLHQGGHRVLLFSQMTRVLDILQDYMEYRGYSYERLDGSVRGEERNLAIKNFSSKDVFVFLLSTKAGGVGMNLTSADTVIFMDSDFNPQNDLQAAARAHRIGQKRAVKVIRLLGRDTVEEIIYSRAASKLQLTNTIIEEGRFSLLDQLSEILKFGVDKLLASEESSVQDVDLGLILGRTEGGQWLVDEDDTCNHMYIYEGRDYSRDPSSEDQRCFDQLVEELQTYLEAAQEGRALRYKAGVSLSGPLVAPLRRKRVLTEAELELRREKRREAAAKKARLQEDRKRQREEQQYRRKIAWWESCGYHSLCLPLADSDEDDEEAGEEGDDISISSVASEHTDIHYILGDVTHPQANQEDAIIVHCVDDSGHWGRGGLFTALEVRSDEPRKQYELAGKMKVNCRLQSVVGWLIRAVETFSLWLVLQLALIVAQERDQSNNLSGIKLPALEEGLKKIHRVAKQKKASVHLPRIGHSTKGFNWYGTERLIRKHLASRSILTYMYPSAPSSSSSTSGVGKDTMPVRNKMPDFMGGVHVFFYNIAASDRKSLARYLITYPSQVMGSEVTHIVADVESPELQNLLNEHPQALPVQKTWLESCFSKQKRVSTTEFLLELH